MNSAENAHMPQVIKFNIRNLCIATSLVRKDNFSFSENIINVDVLMFC